MANIQLNLTQRGQIANAETFLQRLNTAMKGTAQYETASVNGDGTLYGLRVGGNASRGTVAGLAWSSANNTPSSSALAYGSRLCYLP